MLLKFRWVFITIKFEHPRTILSDIAVLQEKLAHGMTCGQLANRLVNWPVRAASSEWS
jgi:hypothetical protein